MERLSSYQLGLNFIDSVVTTGELGYVYTFPDKRLYSPVGDPNAYIKQAWESYSGPVGLYVHVPYCTPKPPTAEVQSMLKARQIPTDGRDHLCGYCNLFTTIAKEVPPVFVDTLLQEVNLYANLLQGKTLQPTSLYFGGGSPSLLKIGDLGKIVTAIERSFGKVPEEGEKNIECIPDTYNQNELAKVKEIGLNRISVGVQSFDTQVLHYTGRNYDPQLADEMIENALKIGFKNVNGDLIAGLPLATRDIFQNDVKHMADLSPHVVTIYQHMVRPITRFGRMAESGHLVTASSSEIYEWIAEADDILRVYGYQRASLTCWAKDGGRYQQGEEIYLGVPILGFGPNARSYSPDAHYATGYAVSAKLSNYLISQWRQRVAAGQFPDIEGFKLTPDIKRRKNVILGLLSPEGVNKTNLAGYFEPEFQALIDRGMLEEAGGGLKYTENGKTYSGALSRLFYGQEINEMMNKYQHR